MPFSHRASETQLLKQMTPDLIPPALWPLKSLHLNPKEYAVWGIMQFTRRRLRMSVNWVSGLWRNGKNSASMWLTMRSDSGAGDWEAVSVQMVDSLNILWLTFWLPQWTSLSFLNCLTILYRLHCNLFSIVFVWCWLDCSLQRIFIIYSTKSNVNRICIL